MDLIAETIAEIRPLDEAAMNAARELQDRLTKPRGALGELEDLSVRLAGLAGACPPPMPEPAAVAVFAADHGVHAQGVTPWPQEVTGQMVLNFLAGGAVVNAFARQSGATVRVIDVGVRTELPAADGLVVRKVAHGTSDLSEGPAMTPAQVREAVETGIAVARDLIAEGHRCLITGDMGIANTTASAALIAAFTGQAAEAVTGYGTGIDDATHERKIEVVRAALARTRAALGRGEGATERTAPAVTEGATLGAAEHAALGAAEHAALGAVEHATSAEGTAPAVTDGTAVAAENTAESTVAEAGPLSVLAQLGGLEHAAIAGFVLAGAAARVPVVLDGVIAGAAALAAVALAPAARDACVAGHRSAEPGHAAALRHLGLRPLIELDLRLGEGTGALLALPLVQSAVRVLHEVATFDSAGVADKA